MGDRHQRTDAAAAAQHGALFQAELSSSSILRRSSRAISTASSSCSTAWFMPRVCRAARATRTSAGLRSTTKQGIEQGGRVRERLRDGVQEALEILGTGLLAHPESGGLAIQIRERRPRQDRLLPPAATAHLSAALPYGGRGAAPPVRARQRECRSAGRFMIAGTRSSGCASVPTARFFDDGPQRPLGRAQADVSAV